jgi:alpha-glucosidase
MPATALAAISSHGAEMEETMTDWWRGGVIYQIYPRSFQDSSGDGVGDLPGIIARLDHVASLGVDAIWLSPFFTSPMDDMGYDISDYFDVDPLFGSLDDFDLLVEKAHALGIKVIIDQVISHSSDRNPWFVESKSSKTNAKADWYVWADANKDGSPPNNWVSVFGGPSWEWNATRRQYYLHNFLISQPDFNFHNPEVQDAMLGVLRFWLERGVDGFRFDTVNFYFHDEKLRNNPPAHRGALRPEISTYDMQAHVYDKNRPENLDFLKKVRKLLDEFGAMSVGEIGDIDAMDIMAAYTGGTKRLQMAYTFDMLRLDYVPETYRSRVESFFKSAANGWPCWSFSNHDVIRHVTRWADHANTREALARQAIALLLSLKGSVCLYQGEELGMTEAELAYEELTDPPGIRFWPENKGRDGCRTPIPWEEGTAPNGFTTGKPWLPIKPEHSVLSVARQNADPNSVLNRYRALIAFRKEHAALVLGDIRFLKTDAPVLAFRRDHGDKTILCAFNLSAEPVSVRLVSAKGAELLPASEAGLSGTNLNLPENGYAFVAIDNAHDDARITYKRPKEAD